MKVKDWLARHPATILLVPAGNSLVEALDRMLERPEARDAYVIDERKRVIGHLGRRRLVHHLFAAQRPVHTRRQLMDRIAAGTAHESMSRHFATARPDEDLDEVFHRMLEHDVEDLPVIDDDGMLRGAVNLAGLLRWFRSEADRG
jgi:CBS-domain-containing membrane protein